MFVNRRCVRLKLNSHDLERTAHEAARTEQAYQAKADSAASNTLEETSMTQIDRRTVGTDFSDLEISRDDEMRDGNNGGENNSA